MTLVTSALLKTTKPWIRAKKEKQAHAKQLVEARETANRGRGLFSLAAFNPGELVCPIEGRIDKPENLTLAEHGYGLKNGNGDVIVPDVSASGWHCANHSCVPNAALTAHRGLSAIKHIRIGAEITCDYGWHLVPRAESPCLCGEPDCLGTMGLTRLRDTPVLIAHYKKHRSFDALAGFLEATSDHMEEVQPHVDRAFFEEFSAWVRQHHYFYGS